MSNSVVLPFRKRPPSKEEMTAYRQMTRAWHPDLRRQMFPEHFALEALAKGLPHPPG